MKKRMILLETLI